MDRAGTDEAGEREPRESGTSAGSISRSGRGTLAVAVLSVLALVVGLLALGVFGWRYSEERGAQDEAGRRDRAVDVATQVLVNAYSFDYKNVDESIARLQDASTGDFLEQQKQWAPDVKKRVVEQKAVTRASVTNAAVEAFDPGAGTSTVLFVFTAESTREKLPPVTARQAAKVDLQADGNSWKVSGLTPVGVIVPVGQSSASVQELGGAGAATPSSAAAPAPGPTSPSAAPSSRPTSPSASTAPPSKAPASKAPTSSTPAR